MANEWKGTVIKIPNAPDYIDKITALIIEENSNLNKDITTKSETDGNQKVMFNADITDENNQRLVEAYQKLVAGIRAFEEALLYL